MAKAALLLFRSVLFPFRFQAGKRNKYCRIATGFVLHVHVGNLRQLCEFHRDPSIKRLLIALNVDLS